MTVLDRIRDARARRPVHMTLLDPDKQAPREAARIAEAAGRLGTDAVLIGGSSPGLSRQEVAATVRSVRAAVGVPVILFPSNAAVVSAGADAIFFMSLLNSRSPRYLVREQKAAAPAVREAKLEPIPLGYLLVEPGMRVGEVGQADLIARDDVDEAVRYALAAEYFGMAIVYLEAGSGAAAPIRAEMVSGVRQAVSILVAVGGGVRRPDQASALVSAGADIVVTGTVVERCEAIDDSLGPIIEAVRRARQGQDALGS